MCLSETYSKVRIDKYFSHAFPIQNDLKKDASRRWFSSSLWRIAVYSEDVNFLGKDTDALKQTNTINARKENLIWTKSGQCRYIFSLVTRMQDEITVRR